MRRKSLLPLERLTHQPNDFAGFGVTVGLEFGIDQFITHFNLEFAGVRRRQYKIPDIEFKVFQQIGCQAHGPVGVVSNCAVDDFNINH